MRLPSTLETKTTTIGRGKRFSFAPNENPSPDFYNITSQFDPLQRKSGVIFGSIPLKNPQDYKIGPGPGAYYINRSFISQNKGVKLKFRKPIISNNIDNPAPNCYNISEKLIKNARNLNVSMGKGKRYQFFNKSKK